MAPYIIPTLQNASLAGARIWLSGSLPEVSVSSETERSEMLAFVRNFASQVFRMGGHILHGSHPSFTPVLLEEAKNYQRNGGKKDCLALAVSRYWSKDSKNASIEDWRKSCMVYETSEASGTNARNDSLDILRKWMAARCDVIVVVGGKWWQEVAGQAGVPLEVGLALDRGIPCFLLAGLGGAAREFVAKYPHLLQQLKNGFDEISNRKLATEENVGALVQTVCDQLERLPLVRGRSSDGVSFRILALDGGGLKGAFTAAALAAWEAQTKLRAVDHFDLIAGTSTGGILAIGLGLGLSGKQMLEFYQERGSVIFPVTSFRSSIRHTFRHLFFPKFSQEILLRELKAALYGGKPAVLFGSSQCRLLIPSYHAVAGASHLFRTPHHPDLTADAYTEAADVALATAAAPTFFSAAKIANMVSESSYFDGGVWANCPAMAAIVEAVCYLRIPMDRIDVLSVGTTEEPFTVRKQTRAGIFRWSRKLLKLFMNAQEESSLRHARLLAGEPRFLRVNVMTSPKSYSLDGPKEIGELADLGNRAALDPVVLGQVKSRFLNGVAITPWERF
ncbi:MAG: CBASS cGAMP-activated phospholipase [bacterium]